MDGDVEGGLWQTLFVPRQALLRNSQKESQRLVDCTRVRESLGHVRSQLDRAVLWLFPAWSPSHHTEGTEIVLRAGARRLAVQISSS